MALPEAETLVPDNITSASAILHGRCVSMGGLPTTITFTLRWGPNWAFKEYGPFTVTHDDETFWTVAWLETWQYINSYRVTCQNEDGISEGDWVDFWAENPNKPAEGSPWYLFSEEGYWDETDYKWTCWTDTPAELTLRVSDRAPLKKRGAHYKRGTVFKHSPIVYWPWVYEVEQEEEGDSREHNFTIPFDLYQDSQWWQAHGKVDGKSSPSRSPFFHETYREIVRSLGIYSEAPPLTDHVFLEEGFEIVLTYDAERNVIIISDSLA